MTEPEILPEDEAPVVPGPEDEGEPFPQFPQGSLPTEADEGDVLEQTQELPPEDDDYPEGV